MGSRHHRGNDKDVHPAKQDQATSQQKLKIKKQIQEKINKTQNNKKQNLNKLIVCLEMYLHSSIYSTGGTIISFNISSGLGVISSGGLSNTPTG